MRNFFKLNLIIILLIAAILIIIVWFIVFSNSSFRNEIDIEEQNSRIVLGFCQVATEGVWRSVNTDSIKQAAEDENIRLIFLTGEDKKKNQYEEVLSLIAQKVDVLAFSPSKRDGWDDVLLEAKNAGIPVIITDRSVLVEDDSLWLTCIGSDFTEEGRKAARWLLEYSGNLSNQVNIVELEGIEGSTPAINRKKGFSEIIDKDPRFKIIESISGDFTRARGEEVMWELLSKYGSDINVVYSHNDDMAFGAISAIEEYGLKPGQDIIIISTDAVKLALEEIINGRMNCTVECNPLLGPALMQAVKDVMAGNELPKRIYIDETIFTIENAQDALPYRVY